MKVLLIDDEPDFLEIGKLYLERKQENLDVETIASAAEALEILEDRSYDAVVSDYKMPFMNGLELLKNIRKKGNDTPFFILTGKGNEEVAREALNLKATGYFKKSKNLKKGFSKLADVLVKSALRKRSEKEQYLIAWIEKKTVADIDPLKYDLKKLAEKVGFKITEMEIQAVSPTNEIIKTYTNDYPSVPREEMDKVKEWRERVTWSPDVVDVGIKVEEIKRDSTWIS